MFAAGAPASAQDTRSRATASPPPKSPPNDSRSARSLVERHGQRGTPMILIPGLASGSWVWQDAIRTFRDDHVLYVVTLPGFDGRAPVAGNMLDAARQSLQELIASRKLAKPVLVGHSLGGTLALAVAQQRSGPGRRRRQHRRPAGLPGHRGHAARAAPAAGGRHHAQHGRPDPGGIRRPAAAIHAQHRRGRHGARGRTGEADRAQRSGGDGAVHGGGDGAGPASRLAQIKAPVLVLAPFLELDAADPNAGMASKVGVLHGADGGNAEVEAWSASPARATSR